MALEPTSFQMHYYRGERWRSAGQRNRVLAYPLANTACKNKEIQVRYRGTMQPTQADPKIYPIGSNEFKKLSFKDQVKIAKLYIEDRESYQAAIGERVKDPSLDYIDNRLGSLTKTPNTGHPVQKDGFAIAFIEDHWSCYTTKYESKWFEDGLSPIDMLGIHNKKLFNFQLFTFPLIQLDDISQLVLTYLLTQPHKTKSNSDLFYFLVKLRATIEYFVDPLDTNKIPDMVKSHEIWDLSVNHLNSYPDVQSINESFPIVEESFLRDLIEEMTLVMYYFQSRRSHGRNFVPLIPAELYRINQFSIKTWDFLVTK